MIPDKTEVVIPLPVLWQVSPCFSLTNTAKLGHFKALCNSPVPSYCLFLAIPYHLS